MGKNEIRAEMRRCRKRVSPSERAAASATVCKKLLSIVHLHLSPSPSPIVSVYLASTDEIDLTRFIEDGIMGGVRLVVPRWNGNGYELAELNGCWPNGLVAGPHAILEPPQSQPLASEAEVGAWIVPGLAFAKDGARLGYGGGWYDRLMRKSHGRKIGVGYRFQLVESLPSEPHDIRLDEIVTD